MEFVNKHRKERDFRSSIRFAVRSFLPLYFPCSSVVLRVHGDFFVARQKRNLPETRIKAIVVAQVDIEYSLRQCLR